MSRRRTTDVVTIAPHKLQWHMQQHSLSKSRMADLVEIDRKTIYRMLDAVPVRRSTVQQVAEKLGVPIQDLLPDAAEPVSQSSLLPWTHPEWELVDGTLMPFVAMSNGLVMRTAQVRHRFLSQELGRGRLYDITGMPHAVRDQCRRSLTRHAEVSRKLASSTFIAENLTMTSSPDGAIWTSVDRWFSSETLGDVTESQTLTKEQVCRIMSGVGSALQTLHAHQIIYRELHPSRILLNDSSDSQLTDLDLAKLLAVEGSVSCDWLRNEFRAPEVAGGESHPQADIYSFALLFAWLLSGGDHDVTPNETFQNQLPAGELRDLLLQSLSPVWHRRPESMQRLLDHMPKPYPDH